MKKLIILLLAIPLLVAPMQAVAQVTKSTSLKAAVRGKSLTLVAPANVTMDPIDVSATETATSGTMTGIEVSDLRGKKTPLGWSLTMTATDFKTTESDVIPVSNLIVKAAIYKHLNGKDGGITVPGEVSVKDSDGDATSDAITLMNAAAGFGAGGFSVDPILQLTVPPYSVEGDYQSTVTITLL